MGELGFSAVMSPEIVEIVEEKSGGSLGKDVYVAVGRNDLCILRWALEHVVSPGSCIFLVHVFPPITHIPSPGTSQATLVLVIHLIAISLTFLMFVVSLDYGELSPLNMNC